MANWTANGTVRNHGRRASWGVLHFFLHCSAAAGIVLLLHFSFSVALFVVGRSGTGSRHFTTSEAHFRSGSFGTFFTGSVGECSGNYCSSLSCLGSSLPAGLLCTTLSTSCPEVPGRRTLESPIRFVWTICSVGANLLGRVDCRFYGGLSGAVTLVADKRTPFLKIGSGEELNGIRGGIYYKLLNVYSLLFLDPMCPVAGRVGCGDGTVKLVRTRRKSAQERRLSQK